MFYYHYDRYCDSLVFDVFCECEHLLTLSFLNRNFSIKHEKFYMIQDKEIEYGLKNFWKEINDKVCNMSTKYTEFIISMKYV